MSSSAVCMDLTIVPSGSKTWSPLVGGDLLTLGLVALRK
jgi:hypothetical protein